MEFVVAMVTEIVKVMQKHNSKTILTSKLDETWYILTGCNVLIMHIILFCRILSIPEQVGDLCVATTPVHCFQRFIIFKTQ